MDIVVIASYCIVILFTLFVGIGLLVWLSECYQDLFCRDED